MAQDILIGGVLIALVTIVGFVTAIVRPLIKLNTNITNLNVTMKKLCTDTEKLEIKNAESHRRIWKHNEKQDGKIDDHEKRIHKLEGS